MANTLTSSPRLIALDMDGTLLHSSGHISPRNLAALHAAQASGIEVVIATGRRHSYAMRALRGLHLPANNALISSNGTVIRTLDAHLLHRTHMPLSTALWLCKYLDHYRNALVITFDLVGPTGDDSRGALVCEHLDDLHASIGLWMRANESYIAHVHRLEDALQPHSLANPPIQMMLAGPIARMAAAEAHLLADPRIAAVGAPTTSLTEITLHRTIYPEHDLCLVDIMPAGCSKASALRILADLRAISPADILAIGDNWNDLPMLEFAGHSVLMANAPAELHHRAHTQGWTICPPNDDDGVAHALESLLPLPTLTY